MEQSTKLRDALNEYDSEFWTWPRLNESRNSSLLRPAPSVFFCSVRISLPGRLKGWFIVHPGKANNLTSLSFVCKLFPGQFQRQDCVHKQGPTSYHCFRLSISATTSLFQSIFRYLGIWKPRWVCAAWCWRFWFSFLHEYWPYYMAHFAMVL